MARAVDIDGNESADINFVAVILNGTGGTASNTLIDFE